MPGSWSETQTAIRQRYLEVGRHLVRPSADQRDRELNFDRALWRRLGQSGLFGVHMPRAYGGQGHGIREFAAALEGFAEGSQDMGVLVSVIAQVGLIQATLLSHGSEGQCAKWLPPLISGDRVGAFAITEECGGSDVRGLRMTATPDGKGYRLDGQKWNITNAPVADLCMTFARVPGIGNRDITCFVTETNRPGIKASAPFELLGNRGTPIGSLGFRDAAVGPDQVVFGPGNGLQVLYYGFLIERVMTAPMVIGCVEPLLNECVCYSTERQAFGRPIGDNQYIQGHIVDSLTRVELLRSALFRALASLENNEDCSRIASIIKVMSSETLHDACVKAIRIHGNYGYRRDHYYERLLRDSIGLFFAGGTVEVHKRVIWNDLVADIRNNGNTKKDIRPASGWSEPDEKGATV